MLSVFQPILQNLRELKRYLEKQEHLEKKAKAAV